MKDYISYCAIKSKWNSSLLNVYPINLAFSIDLPIFSVCCGPINTLKWSCPIILCYEWSHVDVVLQFLIFFVGETSFFLLYVKLGYLIFCDQCKCKHNKMSKNESLIFFSPVLTEKIEVIEEIFTEVLEWSPNLCRVERITNPLLGKMAQTWGFGSLVCILRLD